MAWVMVAGVALPVCSSTPAATSFESGSAPTGKAAALPAAGDRASTIVFPLPMDLLGSLLSKGTPAAKKNDEA